MRAIAVLVAVACAQPASAEEWRGGGSLALDLRYAQMEAEGSDATRAVTAGPRVRGVVGKQSPLALAVGVDLQLGATGGRDFAYQLALSPLGVAVMLGRSARIGAIAGAGVSGITGGALPIAFALPVEGFAELSLGDHLRLATWGRATALYGSDSRQAGAEDAPFGDELEVGLTLRWDRRRSEYRYVAGNGYQLGATWGQQGGAEVIGVSFGYSLDAAAVPAPEPIPL